MKELKQKPDIKSMGIAPADSNASLRRFSRSPNVIPPDTIENRSSFKSVPGVSKFLQR